MSNIVDMDIYITPEGGSKIHIPVNPEKLQLGSDAKFITFSPINGGEVKIPHGSAPEEISWSGIFVGAARKKQAYVKEYTAPNTLIANLKSIRNKGTKVTLVVTGTKINNSYYISSFKGKYSGGYGDFYYDIKLVLAREIKISTITAAKKTTTTKTTTTRKTTTKSSSGSSSKTSKYTVQSGDTLWGIATKKLGKGSRYTEIYNLNKSTIEAAAKKHGKSSSNNGHWIYTGTVLTIPAK